MFRMMWTCKLGVRRGSLRTTGVLLLAALMMAGAPRLLAQEAGRSAETAAGAIRGQVSDPTGAVIPDATVVILTTEGKTAGKTTSDAGGVYIVHGLPPGTYSVMVTAPGFAAYGKPGVVVGAGQVKNINPSLQLEVTKQEVQVQADNTTISTSPDENANAVVIKGNDLNSLSDDPDELQNELTALAGPSAGPNGGEVYIDGFTGGQLPPKSSIREIRVNQNPFSAAYDRLGYGRIEIFTKPGTDKIHGQFEMAGNDSHFNSQNPLLVGKVEPPYYAYFMHGSVGGPISKSASYFFSLFARNNQNINIILAANPSQISDGAAKADLLNATFSNPSTRLSLSPRFDIQLGPSNTLTVRWEFNRSVATNSLGGSYSLQSQATNSSSYENELQVSDSIILNKNLVDDVRFEYRRVRDAGSAVSNLPSYSLQQTFTGGGNNQQSSWDHENNYELQDYISGAYGRHSLNFGTRIRAYNDVNSTTSGSNGSYSFGSQPDFVGCLQNPPAATCKPQRYSYTNINNPIARATLFDAALFYQDDWKVNPRLTFSYGLRWETQNRINDKSDWAPRVAVAYALDGGKGRRAKTVVRAGYGWFYQRFTVPNGFGSSVPTIMTAIHQNGVNQQQFIQSQDIVFNPNQTTKIDASTAGTTQTGSAAPTVYTVSPHFKAANDMEAAAGVDRQLSKTMTGNVTYVFSQGIHQYFTDNISAAALSAGEGGFPLSYAMNGEYPSYSIAPPPTNNLQYQSGGFYKEHQVMVTLRANYRRFSFFTNYTYTDAKGDTSGVGSVPSVSSFPGLDYGRTTFDVRHRFMLFGNFMLPYKVSASPMIMANAGTPFNIVVGPDLTGNNQFNGRPTYAPVSACAAQDQSAKNKTYYSTPFGCLNANPTDPSAAGQKIIPYGVGTGPSNVSLNMRLSKVIGVGPKLGEGQRGAGGGGFHGGPRGMGGGGFSGNRGGPGRIDQEAARKYSLTLSAWGTNLLNHTNYGAPSGVMASQNFLTSQSLASGFFRGPSSSGNRTIFLQAMFSF